jgi:cell division protein FtsB
MAKLWEFLSTRKRLWQQQRELVQLRKEVSTLRAQNDSMREGMRRCVTCDYRIDFKRRQNDASGEQQFPAPIHPDSEP